MSPSNNNNTSSFLPIVGNLLSNVANNIFGSNAADVAWERQQKADALAYQRQVELWNMQNKYAAPAAQMQRFVAAGLNPNLIYGQTQDVSSVPSVSSGNITSPFKPSFGQGFLDSYLQLKSFDLNAQKNAAEIANIQADTELKASQTNTNLFNLDSEKGLADLKKALLQAGLSEKQASVAVMHATINKIVSEVNINNLTSRGLSFDNEYKEKTLEDRILSAALGNAYLDAQIKYINSRTDLSKSEKDKLIQEIQSLSDYNDPELVTDRKLRQKYLTRKAYFDKNISGWKEANFNSSDWQDDFNDDPLNALLFRFL